MQVSDWPVRRTDLGTIDYAYHKERAVRLRQHELQVLLTGNNAVFRRLLRRAPRLAIAPAAAIWAACRALLKFWNIAPLGTVGAGKTRFDEV